MKTYCFDVDDAISYGANEAIMLYNLKHWISHNMANGRNTHDSRTWTYNSKKAFSRLFPFWSESQIKRILNSLLNQNVILTGNYNKSAYDRTLWYALVDETNMLSWIGRKRPMDESKMTNQLVHIDQPIPDINTNITTKEPMSGKPDGTAEQRDLIIQHLNLKTGARFKPNSAVAKKHLNARLADGHSVEDFMLVIDYKTAEWTGDHKMQKFLRPATLFGSKFDDYLATSHIPIVQKPVEAIDILINNIRENENESSRGVTVSGPSAITDRSQLGQKQLNAPGSDAGQAQAMGEATDPFGW